MRWMPLTPNSIVKHFNLRATSIAERSEQGAHLPRGGGRAGAGLYAAFPVFHYRWVVAQAMGVRLCRR